MPEGQLNNSHRKEMICLLLYSFLSDSAKRDPEKLALIYRHSQYSYSDLKSIVDNLSGHFRSIGINEEMRVACVLKNSPALVFSIFALSKCQNITLLINCNAETPEIVKKVKDSRMDAIIADNEVYKRMVQEDSCIGSKYKFVLVNQNNMDIPCLKDLYSDDTKRNLLQDKLLINKNAKALIQTSSGTTGVAKMAYRSVENIYEDSNNIIETLEYSNHDTIFMQVPFYHGYGLTMGLISPIRMGATITFDESFLPNRVLRKIKEFDNVIFLGVPETYEFMNRYMGSNTMKISNKKWMICSSSHLEESIGLEFKQHFDIWLNQLYGMMEISTISINLNPTKNNFMSVGQSAKNVEVKLDSNIYVKSKTISPQYIVNGIDRDIELNDGWFNTKDFGEIRNENLYITSRDTK